MTAIILAAGCGSRLRSIHTNKPKCLFPIHKITILKRMVYLLNNIQIKTITLIIGYESEQVITYVQEVLQPFAPHITWNFVANPKYATTNTAVSLALALEHVQDDFILLDGDVVFSTDVLKNLINQVAKTLYQHPVLVCIPNHYDPEAVKVSINQANELKHIGKEISKQQSWGEYIGIGFYPDRIRKPWQEAIHTLPNQAYYEDGLACMKIEDFHVRILPIQQQDAIEIDTPEDARNAERWFSEG